MPMSKAGRKIKKNLEEQYGKEKGKQVFYAMENKGKIPGMNKGGDMMKKVPEDNKGLAKLPKGVRNKMGYMAKGGMASKKKSGYAKGGMANCGASMKPNRKARS